MSSGTTLFGAINTPFYQKKVWSGEDTPYALRIKGIFNPNTYSLVRTNVRQSPAGLMYNQSTKSTTKLTPWQISGINTSGAPSYVPVAVHLSDLLDKWKNTDLNLGVSLGEGKESLSMVADRLLSLARAARSLKKGNLGGALREIGPVPKGARVRAQQSLTHKDPSSAFLELHLGWSPLIQDIYSGLNIDPPKAVGHKFKSKRKLGTPRGITYANPDVRPFSTIVENICQDRLVCRVLNTPTFYDRFGLNNPYAIAWELVPFSFVVDYFLPIGDTISALEAVSKLKTEYMLLQRFERYTVKQDYPDGSQLSPTGYEFRHHATLTKSYIDYKRTRPVLNVLSIIAQSAQVRLPSSVMRLATMASLAHLQLSSLLSPKQRASRRKFANIKALSIGENHWASFL